MKYPRAVLCLLAALPFAPGTYQILHSGIPDVLFEGDSAALELGALHAAHGAQFVGPYSRFVWSHPGPMFFYMALPIYKLVGERGAGLSLFAFVVDFVCAVAIVFTARRLRGDLFAVLVAALLGIYETMAVPYLLGNEWNPVLPMLPLALLSLLTGRLARGDMNVAPLFAVIASAIVQTHIGYAPEVIALCALAFSFSIARTVPVEPRPRAVRVAVMTAVALGVCWGLPVYEQLTSRPGNLGEIVNFFTTRNPSEHSWYDAVAHVGEQLAILPLAGLQAVRWLPDPPVRWVIASVALGQMSCVAAAIVAARRRRDLVLLALATIALSEVLVAVAAVLAIRGDVFFYLITWISTIGFVSCIAAIAWLLPPFEPLFGERRMAIAVCVAGLLLLGVATTGPIAKKKLFRDRNIKTEQLAVDVEKYLTLSHVKEPVIGIVSHDSWPKVIAVILHLYKRRMVFYVERDWLFVAGKTFAADGREHPALLFGDQAFDLESRGRRDRTFVAASDNLFVYLQDGRLE